METSSPGSRPILYRTAQRGPGTFGRRHGRLIIGGVVGSALVVATGGAVLDVASIRQAPALETTVIDLALPGSAAEPDQMPGSPHSSADAGKITSPDPSLPETSDSSSNLKSSRQKVALATGRSDVPSATAGWPAAVRDSDRPPVSRVRLEATIEDSAATSSRLPAAMSSDLDREAVTAADVDSAATSSPQSAVTSSDLDREAVTAANIGPEPGETAMPSVSPETTAPVDTEAPTTPAHRVTVSSGDSLYLIFKRLGLPQRELALMTGSKPLAKKLARIAPRQEIEFYVDTESRLARLVHRLDRIRSLHVTRDGDAFTFEEVVEPPEASLATATGIIDSSLFKAGQRVGLSDNIIMQMAEIFGWDVDFALDIRAGDRFALLFEEQLKDGERIGEGPIVAAEFTNRGRRIRAIRYVDPTGRADYFSPDGRSMRKAFLRTPVNFTRISSRFSFGRRHPILHKMRAHRGVDYAAPRGTAVKASGDGRVVFAGRKGGYGRTVILQHGSAYTTLYAHLARIPKGVRPGKRVEQGQVIGSVGSTGLATGPHLHYEFRVRGVHHDPLKVKLPQAAPLAEGYMADFREKAEPLLARLDLSGRTSIATAD